MRSSGHTSTSHAPAFNTTGEFGYTPKKGTGVPVRTILAVMEQLNEKA